MSDDNQQNNDYVRWLREYKLRQEGMIYARVNIFILVSSIFVAIFGTVQSQDVNIAKAVWFIGAILTIVWWMAVHRQNVIANDYRDLLDEADPSYKKWRINREARDTSKGYVLLRKSVASTDNLPDEGRLLVIVARVHDELHIRIFDARGKRVIDKPENELVGDHEALKNRLMPYISDLAPEETRGIIETATSMAGHKLKGTKRKWISGQTLLIHVLPAIFVVFWAIAAVWLFVKVCTGRA